MKKGPFLLLVIALCVLIISCSKQGADGPAGSTGAQGPAGAAGASGTNGTNGATGAQGPAGTANVIYSNWFTNDEFSQSWTDSTIDVTITGNPEIIVRAIKYASGITSGILDSGVVLSYTKSPSLISPQLLPWLFSYTDENSVTMYCQMNLVPMEGGLLYYISNQTIHDATALSPNSGFEYRYIIIPGGVLTTGRKLDPRHMSYSEVCKTYHIAE